MVLMLALGVWWRADAHWLGCFTYLAAPGLFHGGCSLVGITCDTGIFTLTTPTSPHILYPELPCPHLPTFFLPDLWPVSQAFCCCSFIICILTSEHFSFHTKGMTSCTVCNSAYLLEGFHLFFKVPPLREAVVQLPSSSVCTYLGSWPLCNSNSGFFFLRQLVGRESLQLSVWAEGGHARARMVGAMQLAYAFLSCPCPVLAVPPPPYSRLVLACWILQLRSDKSQLTMGSSGHVVTWCPMEVCFALLANVYFPAANGMTLLDSPGPQLGVSRRSLPPPEPKASSPPWKP